MSAPIAVVGIGAQLPSGSYADVDMDYRSFFDFLLSKGEAYETIPSDRLNLHTRHGKAVGQVLTDTGVFLKDLDMFDHMEFGISNKDAKFMTLSLRRLLETSFLALSDSGIEYRGKNVGCYMSGVAYDMISVSGHEDAEINGSFAYSPSMTANRISYHLDLRGPSLPLDTACSSSLYATHLAVQALLNGECDAAVVGGSQINNRFTEWLAYTQGGILSPDGKCKPFDVTANGFGRGEAVVSIVLKPLEAALRDNDHVYCTILGTGVNSSGSLVPANAPSAYAQRDAMHRAFKQAGRAPQEVDFIELHATGTAQGDPTEANWVGSEFQREDELVIGSVKGNVGHLEITAFLASLCKVCGIFETGLIPPNVNLNKPNPAIRWQQYRLRVPLEAEPLKIRSPTGRALVAMTSSGIGGANGHAVIESYPAQAPPPSFWVDGAEVPSLLVAGALSPRSVAALGESLLGTANTTAEKAALARLYGRRVRSMTWRSFSVIGASKTSNLSKPLLTPKARPPIVFVFSGQGTQHWQMGRQLFQTCAPFRASVIELDAVYKSVVGKSLIEDHGLFVSAAPDSKDPLGDPWPIALTLPSLTLLQLALVDALAAAGVRPDVVIGHSAGETAVLSASGAASKYMALEIAIARGRAMALVEEAKGTMAAVNCSPQDAQKFIGEVHAELGEGVLTIGCYNTPGAVTLSGAETHIDLAVAKATAAGVFARKLKTRVPVHSQMMGLCGTEFQKLVSEVFSRYKVSAPTVETWSTMTGGLLEQPFPTSYFWDGTIGPVRFTEAVEAMAVKHKAMTFVEIGPHPVLASYLQTMTQGRDNITVTCPLRRARTVEPGMEPFEFMTALGKVVAAGHNCVNFDTLYGAAGAYTGALPAYPFARKHLPWYYNTPEVIRQRQERKGPLNYPQLQMNVKTHPGLADHVMKGEPIMPAAGFIEMALEYGASEVYDIHFHGLLALSSEKPVPVQIALDGMQWSVSSSSTDSATTWPLKYNRLHASGFLSMDPIQEKTLPRLDIDAIRSTMKPVDVETIYTELAASAQFGPMYRRIRQCHMNRRSDGAVEALTEIRAFGKDIPNISEYRVHPAILDAVIHIIINPRMTGNYDPSLYHLPSKISAFRLCPAFKEGPLPETIFAHVTFGSWTPDAIVYNFTVTNEQGVPLFLLEGVEIAMHGRRLKAVEKRYDVVLHPTEHLLAHFKHANGYANGHPADGNPSVLIPYVRGEEMKYQKQLAELDPVQSISLLFYAEEGLNGDASIGLARSLRKEYPAWTVRVAVFDPSWSAAQREKAARHLNTIETAEIELHVDAEGVVLSPRVEVAEGPSAVNKFDLGAWAIENGKVAQTAIPHAEPAHAIVNVKSVASRHGSLWEYVGTVEGLAQQVVGIASGPITTHLSTRTGSFTEIAFAKSQPSLGPSVLAPTLVSLALGSLVPKRFEGASVLLVEEDAALRQQIETVCVNLGATVISTAAVTKKEVEACGQNAPSFVLSGTRDTKQTATLRHLSASSAKLLLWNHPEEGVAAIAAKNPWSLGDALRNALAYPSQPIQYTPLPELFRSVSGTVPQVACSFHAKKSYVLLGGIGSLGMHIALWMYMNGARNIVLTSRSGIKSLDRRSDYIAQRILVYLQGCKDLSLQTVAVDATSEKDMAAMISGLKYPVGGCMHLITIYSDGTFASHTQESYDVAYDAKVKSFQVLEKVVDINKMDWLVTFSSVAGLFGNPGQTNYASANSALAGMTSKYRNAFCLVAPLVMDTGVFVMSDDAHYSTRLRHFTRWGMTAREVCDFVGDGIMKLRDGPIREYVPDFDWRIVRDSLGPSTVYDYLVPLDADTGDAEDDKTESVSQIVCRVLDLKESEISIDVPLTTYGLDSLSAVALSYALRPVLAISQLQLLADVTIKYLQTKAEEAAAAAAEEA